MGRLNKGLIGVIILSALPLAASAQGPVTIINAAPGSDRPAELGGIPTVDFITLGPIGPGAPLRYGNVFVNSEVVQFDGITLHPGADYLVDYAVGVIYLKVSQRAGQILTVSYRYKPGPATGPGISPSAALASENYAITPGALNFFAKVGLTERANDGSVISSNIFGISDTFKFGPSATLNGLFVVGDHESEVNVGGLSMDGTQRGNGFYNAGSSHLILQDFNASVLGGTVHGDYQDVSRNFTGMSGVSGADAGTLNRLNMERGLTRSGYAVDNVNVGQFQVSSSYHDVRDGMGGLYWRSYGVKSGGFGLNYNTQDVNSYFTRFRDLSDINRNQLALESGLRRENMNGGWAREFGKVAYSSQRITDDSTHSSVNRNEWALNSSRLRFDMGNEKVDSGFMRVSSLMAPEQAEYGREVGIKREWLGFQATLLGKELPFSFNQTALSSQTGSFKAQDASVGSKTWSLDHIDRKVGTGFNSISAMSDPELASNVRTIANMYGTGVQPTGSDIAEFLSSPPIDRKFNGFSTDALKGWKVSGNALDIQGQKDSAHVDSLTASSKNLLLAYRKEDIGTRFSEINSMMDFERLRLGSLQGIHRSDFAASLLEGRTRVDATNLDVSTATGHVERSTGAFDDPNRLNVQVGQRSVSKNFQDGQGLADPEQALLTSLAGYNEADMKVKWNLAPGKMLSTFDEYQYDPTTKMSASTRNTVLDWRLDSTTAFNYTDLEQHTNNPLFQVFSSVVEKMSLTKDFGQYGILKVLDERDEYDGKANNGLDQHRDYLGYQTKLSPLTTFKTEQSYTTYENGVKEELNSNTVSTQISKNTGVSLSDTEVNRNGSPDESHRNYGFWYDLGNGVKLSYGYAREILPNGTDNQTSQALTLGKSPAPGQPATAPGQVGNLMIGGGYAQNQWDANDRTQTNGNIVATTVKPLTIGPIQDAKFVVNLDTGTDYSKTVHENKLFSGQGRYGTDLFGYEYKSQMDPTGNRAIDRTVKFATDPSPKKFISFGMSYKDRTMPDNSTIIIRDYSLTVRPAPNLTLVNLLQTNPDVANPGVLLGSAAQAFRSDKWTLDYVKNPNMTVGAVFQELINDLDHSSSQTAGATMKLFEKKGSPVTLFYGLEAADRSDLWRKTQRYSLQYDQHPGPNQTLSLFVGNLSYEHSVPIGSYSNNNTLRLNYQYRF